MKISPVALLVALGLGATAHAEVIGVQIESRIPVAGDFGAAGPYEVLRGRYTGELDPDDPRNAIITDLALAPRNARGRVDYEATFALSRPVDPNKASGVLIFDTPNRGSGLAVGDADGHMHLISGWQGDLPPGSGRQSLKVPSAPVTGPLLVRIVNPPAGALSVSIRSGLAGGVSRPLPVSLDTSKASLVRRRADGQAGEAVQADDWAFADCVSAPFPGGPDPRKLCLKGGFDPAYAYELIYTAKDAPVLGIGFAAVRDFVAFLRYAPGTPQAPNPIAGQARWVIGTGVSQAGNFIRSFVHLGFNADEDGRIVFDGVNPQIAARQVPLNLRFGVPGGAADLYEPGSEGVLWWGRHKETTRERGETSLLTRCSRDRVCPKVMETFGSAEFWGLRMSPDLVGFEAKADIPLPPEVRRYYFPGVTHGGGVSGFDAPAGGVGCLLPANPNPTADTMRALSKAFVDWVVSGVEPPDSRYPTLKRGDLVVPSAASMGYPDIPGQPRPDDKINPLPAYDYGPEYRADDVSGVMSKLPPATRGSARLLVPRVNRDGNETSGVASVQLQAPLGTYLGWNVQASGYNAGKGCGFQGGFIPFAVGKAERLKAGDPRLSLEERYGTHEGFVAQVRAAVGRSIGERMLLPEDGARIIRQAEDSQVLRQPQAQTPASAPQVKSRPGGR